MEEMRAVVSGISLTPCSSPGDISQVSYRTTGCTLALSLRSEYRGGAREEGISLLYYSRILRQRGSILL